MFNSKNCDVAAEIAARTDGRGADAALEAVGATDPIKTAMSCVRKGGTVTLIGNISPKIELTLQAVVTRQIRLQGSCASSGEYPACIELLSQRRDPGRHDDQRANSAGRGRKLVRPALQARAEPDEGHRSAVKGVQMSSPFFDLTGRWRSSPAPAAASASTSAARWPAPARTS